MAQSHLEPSSYMVIYTGLRVPSSVYQFLKLDINF